MQPALSTPNLSEFQLSVASGALNMAKASMTKGLMESIHKSLAHVDSDNYPPTAQIGADQTGVLSSLYQGDF